MTVSNEWSQLSEGQRNLINALQTELPIRVGAIAKGLGIKVKTATLPAGISGEIKETDGIVTIKINRHDVKSRQRFTLSHEIAHFLLHKHLIGNGIRDDVLYRSSLSDAIEAEANRLAADLLMPYQLIQACICQHSRELKGEALYEKVSFVADVSPTALKIRLGKN